MPRSNPQPMKILALALFLSTLITFQWACNLQQTNGRKLQNLRETYVTLENIASDLRETNIISREQFLALVPIRDDIRAILFSNSDSLTDAEIQAVKTLIDEFSKRINERGKNG
jgi:hypothetical protein